MFKFAHYFIVMLLSLFAIMPAFAQEGILEDPIEIQYTVQPGDTIQFIANTYDVTVDDILVRNGIIDPNRITRGQVIIVPLVPFQQPTLHIVQPGENLTDIATRYDTTVETLQQDNDIVVASSLEVGTEITLPAASGVGGALNVSQTYMIDRGDTLRTIGERFGVSWQTLATVNNIPNPNMISAGMVITIPPAGTVATTTVTNFGTGGPVIAQPVTPIQPIVAQPIVPTYPTYTVRAGDTMFAIANAYDMNVYAIAQANGILNLNSIFTGQILNIPQ